MGLMIPVECYNFRTHSSGNYFFEVTYYYSLILNYVNLRLPRWVVPSNHCYFSTALRPIELILYDYG